MKPILHTLRRAVEQASSSTQQLPDVRAALDAMIASAKDRDAVQTIADRFWRAAGEPSPSIRVTWITAVLQTIEAQFPAIETAVAAE